MDHLALGSNLDSQIGSVMGTEERLFTLLSKINNDEDMLRWPWFTLQSASPEIVSERWV